MSDPPLPIRSLVEAARRHAASALPTETLQSLPVPMGAGGDAAVGFFYAPTALQRGAGLWVYPPSSRALFRAQSGELVEAHPLTPRDLGLDDPAGRALGTHRLPAGTSAEQYTALLGSLLDHYDTLLPHFFNGIPGAPPQVLADFGGAFATVAEAVLIPYYRAMGRRFFAWVDASGHE